jgi:hypothetical protein
MKSLLCAMAVAFLMCMTTTSAKATLTVSNLQTYVGSLLTLEHCRRVYHCRWISKGADKTKHCHVCG